MKGKQKMQKPDMPAGMHKMPGGTMMSDKEMVAMKRRMSQPSKGRK